MLSRVRELERYTYSKGCREVSVPEVNCGGRVNGELERKRAGLAN